MEWNVFRYNMNSRKIETFNIFDHGGFNKYVKEAIKTYKTKEEFAKQLETELLYYFWFKAEYERIGADGPKDEGERSSAAIAEVG